MEIPKYHISHHAYTRAVERMQDIWWKHRDSQDQTLTMWLLSVLHYFYEMGIKPHHQKEDVYYYKHLGCKFLVSIVGNSITLVTLYTRTKTKAKKRSKHGSDENIFRRNKKLTY